MPSAKSATTWERVGGARLDAVAGMLGHTSATTTGMYARIVDKIAENPARCLEELMGSARRGLVIIHDRQDRTEDWKKTHRALDLPRRGDLRSIAVATHQH